MNINKILITVGVFVLAMYLWEYYIKPNITPK
jgi:hypothetical protein